jgi:hypothetical protein
VSDHDPEDLPTVSCERCGRTWQLDFELTDLQAGNQALEQFALDHKRHTGHFPDGVATWRADCRQCPDGEHYLAERPARRWAETHARHASHEVELAHADDETTDLIEP